MTEPLNDREIGAILTRLDKLEERQNAQERFRAWMLGMGAFAVYILGLFSVPIRKALGFG